MEWVRGPAIGRGATATVSVATAIPSGKIFAVKSAELSHSMALQKEQSVLSKLSSPHIVKYIGHDIVTNSNTQNTQMYNLWLELASGGSLSDQIQRQGGRLDEERIEFYTHQILMGLDYLHDHGVTHCDIKCSNILVGDEGTAKIADLGCAKMTGDGDGGIVGTTLVFSGTPAFMAPEVARGEEQGFAADIWALGCTIIEMGTGNSPWPELNDPVLALYRIGFSSESPEIPGWFSEKAKDFVRKCLEREARQRWTAKELLQHPFLHETGNLKDSKTESPISVLDQGFWDSMESPRDLKFEASRSISWFNISSPVERIKKLIEGENSSVSVSDVPRWNWSEEEWVTVRGNELPVPEEFSVSGISIPHEGLLSELCYYSDEIRDFSGNFDLLEDCFVAGDFSFADNDESSCLSFEYFISFFICEVKLATSRRLEVDHGRPAWGEVGKAHVRHTPRQATPDPNPMAEFRSGPILAQFK